MFKRLKSLRLLFSVFILFLVTAITVVLFSPNFEKTNKGGFFNERDNPDYILLSAVSLAVVMIIWGVIELKHKQTPTPTQ